MARLYLIAGLVCVFAYAGFALSGREFGATKLKRVTPTEAAAAARARRSSGGYYGGGGFGGGK